MEPDLALLMGERLPVGCVRDVFSHRHWDNDYLAGSCNSLPGEAGALERDHDRVASPHVHMQRGVIAHSVGDELTAALLLGHELGTWTCRDQTDEMDDR